MPGFLAIVFCQIFQWNGQLLLLFSFPCHGAYSLDELVDYPTDFNSEKASSASSLAWKNKLSADSPDLYFDPIVNPFAHTSSRAADG